MQRDSNTRKDKIRRLLKSTSTGALTAQDIAKRLDLPLTTVRTVLKSMDDVYIATWKRVPKTHAWTALFAVAHVPADAPRPNLLLPKNIRHAIQPSYEPEEAPAPQEPYRPRTVWATVGAAHG